MKIYSYLLYNCTGWECTAKRGGWGAAQKIWSFEGNDGFIQIIIFFYGIHVFSY